MPDTSTERLLSRRESLMQRIAAVKETAAAAANGEGRDLNDDELTLIREAQDDIQAIDRQLDVLTRDVSMSDEARDRIARVSGTPALAKPASYRSAGQVIWDALHLHDEAAKARYRHALTRAAEHMGTLAADTTPTAGDLAGLVIDPVVGPVVNPPTNAMPFATALGMRPMPAGSFERPYISDPDADTAVGVQALEKAELASKAFTVDSDTVKAQTVGGYLNISQQLLRWTPNSLQIIVDQMLWRLGRWVEAAALTELGNSTGAVELDDAADGPTIMAALYEASAAVFDATDSLATWVLMGPDGWARLGTAVDLSGRPLLPSLGPSNAAGTSVATSFNMTGPAGLNVVVTPAITDASFWVGNGQVMEGYWYRYPILEAVEPSVLGRQIAVAADVVFARPTPHANGAIHVSDTTP